MVDAIIIGTGQSGPSLANRCVQEGMQVVVIERSRFGGSCVNYGCTPTKALVASAKAAEMIRQGEKYGIRVSGFQVDMAKVKARKDAIVAQSNEGVEQWLKSLERCQVIEGHAQFESAHRVRVGSTVVEGEKIFINVGARAHIPPIVGLERISPFTNASLLEIDFVPEHLLILGGGYIALEFAQIFRRLGSQVTVLQRNQVLMPKEDHDVSTTIEEILRAEGIQVITEALNFQILPESRQGQVLAQIDTGTTKQTIKGTHLLIAVGRIPNTDDLGLDQAGIQTNEKGFIIVDDELRTSQPHIWAIGDCNGRGAFTHTSYNDFQIVAENLFDGGSRKVSERIPIYALYTDPPLGRVGLTEREVRLSKREALMAKIPMTRVARAREKGETAGFLKILVDAQSEQILGASFLGTGCDEVVQMVAEVMYAKAPYTVLERGVLIHPTVSELVPTLLGQLKPLTREAMMR